MSFGLYILGSLLVIGAMAYGAALANVPTQFIVVGALMLLGLGVLTGVKATRQKDPAG